MILGIHMDLIFFLNAMSPVLPWPSITAGIRIQTLKDWEWLSAKPYVLLNGIVDRVLRLCRQEIYIAIKLAKLSPAVLVVSLAEGSPLTGYMVFDVSSLVSART